MRRGIAGVFGIAGAAFTAAAIVAMSRLGGGPAVPVVKPPPAEVAATPAVRPPPPPGPVAPSFDVVKVAPDGTAVVAGRAEPGAKVTVLDGDKPLGAVTADGGGEWVLVPTTPLPPGDRRLRLEAVGPDGRPAASRQSVALSIKPPSAGNGETALAVAVPRAADKPVTVLQRQEPAGGGGLSLDAVEYDTKGGVALSGHAVPGSSLDIYLDNRPLAEAKADRAGRWTAVATKVPPGKGQLRLDQLGADGKVAHRIAVPLLSARASRLAPGQDYVVQPGNNLWQIARRSYGSGVRYVLIYSANLAKIRDPDLIYPGQVIRLPKS